jgi:hypothetical protein
MAGNPPERGQRSVPLSADWVGKVEERANEGQENRASYAGAIGNQVAWLMGPSRAGYVVVRPQVFSTWRRTLDGMAMSDLLARRHCAD